VLYAKTYAEEQGERIYQRLVALSGCGASGLVVPRPLAYSGRTLWLEQIPGQSMAVCFQPVPGARAVAALHQHDLAGLPRSDKPALLRQLAEIRADAVATGLQTESLSKVCNEIVRRFDELESLPDVTLHGDLTPRNLLVSGDAAGLIDLDDLRRGNPLQESAALMRSSFIPQL
jgi:Phosphotransferase enzyme family